MAVIPASTTTTYTTRQTKLLWLPFMAVIPASTSATHTILEMKHNHIPPHLIGEIQPQPHHFTDETKQQNTPSHKWDRTNDSSNLLASLCRIVCIALMSHTSHKINIHTHTERGEAQAYVLHHSRPLK